jgi:hypothetical protein
MRTLKSFAAILIITLLLVPCASSVEWKATNQATAAWDAVITLEGGDPLPASHTVKYRVYLSNAITDPDKANPALLGETDQLQFVITLNAEGKYFVGVQSVRYDESAVEVSASSVNWSDVNGAATPNPFGLVHYLFPASPLNLR